jgi:HEAT repeat protein
MPSLLTALLVGNVSLMLLLFGMVAVRKTRRDRREHSAHGRQHELRLALLRGGNELDRLFRLAARDRGVQADLVVALALAVKEDRTWVMQAARPAAMRTGLADALEHQLRHRQATVRGMAALLIGRLRLPDGGRLLVPMLRDPDPDVQLVTAASLARIGTGQAAAALIDALADRVMPVERIIERLGGPWATTPMILRLAVTPREDSALRASLARALGLGGHPDAEITLVALLDDADMELRIAAARSLGTCGTSTSVAPLVRALDDPEWQVRAQVLTSLAALGDASAVPAIAPHLGHAAWWVRANAASALTQLGPTGIDALRRAVTGADRYAAERAVEALAMAGLDQPAVVAAT